MTIYAFVLGIICMSNNQYRNQQKWVLQLLLLMGLKMDCVFDCFATDICFTRVCLCLGVVGVLLLCYTAVRFAFDHRFFP